MRRSVGLLIVSVLALAERPSLQDLLVVTATVALDGSRREGDVQDVAVWLTPLDEPVPRAVGAAQPKTRHRMLQKDKRFTPHVLLVNVGASVDFPNSDPFFHNVFSMYDGKRFDLGLYEAGASRSVTFTGPGICYVFCNIHPEMSAVIVVVDTPYMVLSARSGAVAIPNVPPGRYMLSVWHERYSAAGGRVSTREVTISDANRDLGVIRLVDSGTPLSPHKNKYGRDYNPPPPPNPAYQ